MYRTAASLLSLSALALSAVQAPRVTWEQQTIDPEFGIGYAVTVADMNADRKPDIVGVNERQVCWYENPGWQKHVIVSDATPRDNVCIAAADLDRDGKSELVLGAFWKPADTVGSGSVHWLQRGEDPRRAWKTVDLEPEPTVHRMRWADIDGDGKQELLMAPLHGRGNKGPDFEGAGARVVVYRPAAEPATKPWTREIANESLHVVHNLWPVQWDRDSAEEVLLASFEGVHLLDRGADGRWTREKLADGNQATRPNRGSSEIKLGRLPGGRRYLATVEPWHGNQVVIYTPAAGAWRRRVLDETLREGHGVWCADVDGHEGEELIIGWRGPDTVNKRAGVAIYRPSDASGEKWEKVLVDDGGMACEDLTAADLNDDGRVEIIASGRATHNLKVYWNRGAAP